MTRAESHHTCVCLHKHYLEASPTLLALNSSQLCRRARPYQHNTITSLASFVSALLIHRSSSPFPLVQIYSPSLFLALCLGGSCGWVVGWVVWRVVGVVMLSGSRVPGVEMLLCLKWCE